MSCYFAYSSGCCLKTYGHFSAHCPPVSPTRCIADARTQETRSGTLQFFLLIFPVSFGFFPYNCFLSPSQNLPEAQEGSLLSATTSAKAQGCTFAACGVEEKSCSPPGLSQKGTRLLPSIHIHF